MHQLLGLIVLPALTMASFAMGIAVDAAINAIRRKTTRRQ